MRPGSSDDGPAIADGFGHCSAGTRYFRLQSAVPSSPSSGLPNSLEPTSRTMCCGWSSKPTLRGQAPSPSPGSCDRDKRFALPSMRLRGDQGPPHALVSVNDLSQFARKHRSLSVHLLRMTPLKSDQQRSSLLVVLLQPPLPGHDNRQSQPQENEGFGGHRPRPAPRKYAHDSQCPDPKDKDAKDDQVFRHIPRLLAGSTITPVRYPLYGPRARLPALQRRFRQRGPP